MECIHQLSNQDFYVPNWELEHLFLGTFNPSGGQKVNYYYGRPRNKTWDLLSKIFNDSFDLTNIPCFLDKLVNHKIACMDMIHKVEFPIDKKDKILGKGYKDSEIINKTVVRTYNTAKITEIIKKNPGIKVYSTWGKGPTLKNWKNEIKTILGIIPLVSPSMAARVPKGEKKFDYMLRDWKRKI
jgi:G:T/U-mismatch repair DNA glycosylase